MRKRSSRTNQGGGLMRHNRKHTDFIPLETSSSANHSGAATFPDSSSSSFQAQQNYNNLKSNRQSVQRKMSDQEHILSQKNHRIAKELVSSHSFHF